MADLGNQLEGAAGGLERLTEGFDNLMIKLSGVSKLEADMIKEKQSVSKQLAKTNKDKIREEKRALPLQKKMTIQLQQRLKNSTLLNKGLKETIKGMKLFEKGMGGLKKGLGTVGKGMAAIGKAGVIGGLVVGVKFLIDGLLKVDTAMAGMVKSLGITRAELEGVKQAAYDAEMTMGRFGVSFEQTAQEAANLAQIFGNIKYVTAGVIETSLRLQKAYGVSAQNAGQLLETLERSQIASGEFLQSIRDALPAGASMSLVMRDIAANSEKIAVASSRGVEGFKAMAIQAANVGGSLSDYEGIATAWSDLEKSGLAMGKATHLFGNQLQDVYGDAHQMFMLYQTGDLKEINKRNQEAAKLAFKVMEDGSIFNIEKNREVIEADKQAWEELTGEKYAMRQKLLRSESAYGKKLQKEQDARLAIDKKITDEREAQNALMDEQKNVIQRMQELAMGVFNRLTTAFSKLLGIDQTGKGSIHGQITILANEIESIFDFPGLEQKISDKGGGIGGFISAVWGSFKTLGVKIGDWLIEGMEKAITWFQENYTFSIFGGFEKTEQGRLNDQLKLIEQANEAGKDVEAATAGKSTGNVEALNDMETAIEEIKAKGATSLNLQKEKLKGLKPSEFDDIAAQQEVIAAMESKIKTDIEDAQAVYVDATERNARRLETAIKEELEARNKLKEGLDPEEMHDMLVEYGRKMEIKQQGDYGYWRDLFTTDRSQILGREEEFASKAAAELGVKRDASTIEEDTMENAFFNGLLRYGAMVVNPANILNEIGQPQALGGINKKGTTALVGEAGGEVVTSRAALRNGIGVSGRAASALASIGVPGFFRGVSGTTNRQGLMTGFGSEASRGAQAAAFQKEQAIQQAAMVNYWREYYQNKLNNMGGKDQKKKDDLDWLKKFFNENKKDIDTVAKVLLKNQGPAAKEMYKGVFTAMTAWSSGMKTKDALKLGVRAGLTESMKKGGTVYNLFERSNEAIGKLINSQSKATAAMGIAMQSLSVGVQSAMATYAQTGDWGAAKESMKRSAVSGGVTMLATKLLGKDAMNVAKTQMGIPAAAQGKYVNSPTLMMVGEEGRGEVVIPTERIRKGLPINAGVASELGSIGVPGFETGTANAAKEAYYAQRARWSRSSAAFRRRNPGSTFGLRKPKIETDPRDAYGLGDANKSFGGGAKASGAAAALSFAQVYMQTGNMRLAAQAGLEAGVGMAATALLSIPPIPPGVGAILGPMVGKMVGGPLGRSLGITGGQKKARNRVIKNIENHVKSRGIFDYGSPGGMRKNISVAVGGKENVPQEKDYNKLVEKVGSSKVLKPLWQAGIDPSILVAAGSGKLKGQKAFNSFAAINKALYGDAGGDKYMKAMAIPQLADGGIVTKPTTAVIGEAGPEMVIPLHEQKETNATMIKELKKQNELMQKMIKTQIEVGKTEVRLDGRVIAESTAENFYDIGNGV